MHLQRRLPMTRAGFFLLTVFTVPGRLLSPRVMGSSRVCNKKCHPMRSGLPAWTVSQMQSWVRLNQWLRERFNQMQATVSAEVRASDAIQREAEIERRVAIEVEAQTQPVVSEKTLDDTFEAEIVSPFSGWRGGAVFTLSNGQTWRQRNTAVYRHRGTDTRVRLIRGYFGLWRMVVISSGVSVSVSLVP